MGSSGKVAEIGAGLGDGISLKDSRDDRRREEAGGKGGRRANAGFSIRLQIRKVSIVRRRVNK